MRRAKSLTSLSGKGKVSAKGWVVVPKEIRDEMGLQPGDQVQFALWPPLPGMKQDRALYTLHMIRIPEDPAATISGMFLSTAGESSWTENLVKERQSEVRREERVAQQRRKRRTTA